MERPYVLKVPSGLVSTVLSMLAGLAGDAWAHVLHTLVTAAFLSEILRAAHARFFTTRSAQQVDAVVVEVKLASRI